MSETTKSTPEMLEARGLISILCDFGGNAIGSSNPTFWHKRFREAISRSREFLARTAAGQEAAGPSARQESPLLGSLEDSVTGGSASPSPAEEAEYIDDLDRLRIIATGHYSRNEEDQLDAVNRIDELYSSLRERIKRPAPSPAEDDVDAAFKTAAHTGYLCATNQEDAEEAIYDAHAVLRDRLRKAEAERDAALEFYEKAVENNNGIRRETAERCMELCENQMVVRNRIEREFLEAK